MSTKNSNALILTPAQSMMLIEGQLSPEAPLNNVVTQLEIQQAIDVQAFNRAFAALVNLHEAMRFIVSFDAEQFVGRVDDEAPGELTFLDLSSSANSDDQLQRWIQQKCTRVFRLDEKLYEAALIKMSTQRFVFFMNQHHCITDGRSCQVMLETLDRYYHEQVSTGTITSPSPETNAPSLTEYLRARSEYLESEQAGESEAYWSTRFREAVEPVAFYGRSSDLKTLAAARHACVLPRELGQKLLANKRRTPPSVVFNIVLFAFLRRATGNNDICIGLPQLNREREFANTMGLFMEISRNRLTLSEADSFATLRQKVRTEAASIKPHRSHTVSSRNARYEAMLNYRVPADTRFGDAPVKLQRIPPTALLDSEFHAQPPSHEWSGRDSLEVDITHTPDNGEFFVAMDFNTGVWPDPQTRDWSFRHFIRLLEYYFDAHDTPIDQLVLLTTSERQLVRTWNDTAKDFSSSPGIHELFEAQALRSPTAIALEFGGEQLSYQELNDRANRVAHALLRSGVAVDSLVGICLGRSVNLIVALLATLKAGAAYVPLDPNFPEKRRQLVMDEAALDCVITDEFLAQLSLDENDRRNPALACTASTLAYVIFTSGSTGRPKGVMIEHGALVNFIHAAQNVLDLKQNDRLLSVTTVSFDIFALEIFLPFIVGARMVLASDTSVVDGRLLADAINSKHITHMQATPAHWHLLLDADWRPSHPVTALVGGELLTADLAARLKPRCAALRNWYGPSEATVWATQAIVQDDYRAGIIGRPLANYAIHIMDRRGRPTLVGAIGEIAIGGPSLARGYLNRSDLDAAAFEDTNDYGRIYLTGDLGRWTTDGEIEFLGRKDLQVKVRGHRIELGEIEAALLTDPLVSDAVAAVFGEAENKQLAAYVRLTTNGVEEDEVSERLHGCLKQMLPSYMIPVTYTILEAMPLTPNGKIDRKALPALRLDFRKQLENYVAPATPLQKNLCKLWADILDVDRVGIQDDFFELGGHSLMAMRLIGKIESATGQRLQLSAFLQGRTVDKISKQLSTQNRRESVAAIDPLRVLGTRPPFFAVGSHPRYVDVAQRVDRDQPIYRVDVYALQSERRSRGLKLLPGILQLGSAIVDEIQSIQPHGPYCIGGGCEGAMVGFAVAAELQRRGEEVAQLLLWITPAPGYSRGHLFAPPAVVRMGRQLKSLYRHLSVADLKPRVVQEIARHEYIEYRIFRAMDDYQPPTAFDGKIILARTSETRGDWDTDRTLGWRRFAAEGVEVHDLPGDHDTWLNDYAKEFGDLLNSCLRPRDELRD